MKVLIKNEHGDVIDEIENEDPETCCQWVGEAVGETIANEIFARQIVDVVQR